MGNHCAVPVLQQLRRLAGCGEARLSDSELIQRYLDRREETAFEALMERHGAMVLGVCRSVLRNRHDAEDAFQATFLVLANRAQAIRRRDGLASWLHGVARRVSLQARAKAIRRHERDAHAATLTTTKTLPTDDLSWGEVREIVHAEVAALPERFREPLVLCYLEGLTQEEAACRLNWPVTTVKGRLQRGRNKLRLRLERRGLALAAGMTAVLSGQTLASPVPAGLMATTARGAAHFLTPIMKISQATLLAQSALQEMGKLSWKVITTVVLAAGITAGGIGLAVESARRESHDPAAPPTVGLPSSGETGDLRSGSGAGSGDPRPAQADPRPAQAGSGDARPAQLDALGDALPEGAVARLGSVRFNHGDGLTNLRFSSDGKTVFSFGSGIWRLWDAATGKEVGKAARRKNSWDDQIVIAPDGKTLVAVGQEDGDRWHVLDIAQRKEINGGLFPVKRNETSIYRRNAMSPDGKRVVLHTPDRVHVFEIESGKEISKLPQGGKEIQSVVFAGNEAVVSVGTDRTISQWEAQTGRLIKSLAHDPPVDYLAASPDGRLLATLENHHSHKIPEKDVIHLWDLAKGVEIRQLAARAKHWHHNVLFTPDSKRLVSYSSDRYASEVTVWNAETGERDHELKDAVGFHMAVNPEGTRLVAGSNWGKFAMYDLKTGRRLSSKAGQDLPTAAVSLTPHGDNVVATGYQSISSWDVATGRRLYFLETPGYCPMDPYHVQSPDGRYATSITCQDDRDETHVGVWDMVAGKRLHTLRFPGIRQLSTAYSPDSAQLAIWQPGQQTVVRFWNLRTGKETHSFEEQKAGWPGHLFFTPDGKTLIVAGKRIVGYDAANGKETFSWRIEPLPDNSGMGMAVGGVPVDPQQRNPFRRFVVSPEGTLAAGVFDGGLGRKPLPDRIVLVEATTGRIVRRWSDSGKPSNGYEELAFSADGRFLATADDKLVHLWEVATGKELRTFQGHRGEIRSLAFSQDGRRLASSSNDSTVLVWDLIAASLDQSLDDKALAGLWSDLAGDDAKAAYNAVWRMTLAPKATHPLLTNKLRPVPEPDAKKIGQYIKDLDSESFEVREKADKELNALGEAPVPALAGEALAKNPSPEMRRRLESLLDRAPHYVMNPARLQCLRALYVLEQVGSPDARRLLNDLAAGAGYALETQEAKAALRRLEGLAKQ